MLNGEHGKRVRGFIEGLIGGVLIVLLMAVPSHAQTSTAAVGLSWTGSTTPQAQTNLYRALAAAGPFTKLNAAPLAANTYSDATVAFGTTYFYRITAVCPVAGCLSGTTVIGMGESAPSATISAAIPPAPTAPASPTSLTITVTVTVGP